MFKVPLLKGDLGGSRLGVKPRFIKGFSLVVDTYGQCLSPYGNRGVTSDHSKRENRTVNYGTPARSTSMGLPGVKLN